MPYSFDDIDVIDLERALDEGRITPSFVDNNNKSYKISLKSIDDDVLNNVTRSLVTPLPRPASSNESVILFKNIINGNEPVTVDFVSSDLNDFIGNFPMDDLISRPGSRVPSVRTPPPPPPPPSSLHNNRLDSLLNYVKYSDLHEFPPPPSSSTTNYGISMQGYNRDGKRHSVSKEEYPLHTQGYTNDFTRRRSSPSLIDTTREEKRDQLLSAVEKSIRLEQLKQQQRKNDLAKTTTKKRNSLYEPSSSSNAVALDARHWSNGHRLSNDYNNRVNSVLRPQNNNYPQQRSLGRSNTISQKSEVAKQTPRLPPTIPIAEPPQKPRLLPQRAGKPPPLLKSHIENITHRHRAYSMPEHMDDTYKRTRKSSNNNNRPDKAVSYIPQPRKRASQLFENDIKPLYPRDNVTENMRVYRSTSQSLPRKQDPQRYRQELLEHKRHSYIDQSIPRSGVFRSLPQKDRQRVLSDGHRKHEEKKGSSKVVEDAKNLLEFVRERRMSTMSKR